MPDHVLALIPDRGCTYNAKATQKDGTHSEVANIKYRRFKEEGTITLSRSAKTYNITHTIYSGVWRLQLDDPHAENPLITATKPIWYKNFVVFDMGGETYEMIRPSLKKRDYEVGRLGKGEKDRVRGNALRGTKVGELVTDGAMKRSYTVKFDADVSVELPLFCYWFVSLLNRRANYQY